MRFLVRFIGTLIFAAAFVMVVIDGTRTIAASQLSLSSLSEAVSILWPDAVKGIEAGLSSAHPVLWNPAGAWLFAQPAFAVLGILGLLLLIIGRKKPDMVKPRPRRI
jgi:hypothetical protein